MKHLLSLISVILISLLPHKVLAEISEGEINQVQDVIREQLSAFAAGDSITAYSHVAASLREKFISPNQFMSMVKQAYAPLYGTKEYKFVRHITNKHHVMQEIIFEDNRQQVWRAFYALSKNTDNEWKIFAVEIQSLDAHRM